MPIKINIFIWRAIQRRLPTKVNLIRRGVKIDNSLCKWCNRVEETEDHIFLGCSTALDLRAHLTSRWGVKGLPADMLEIHKVCDEDYNPNSPKIEIARRAYLWVLWKYRNDTVFNGKVKSNAQLITDVKLLAYFWFCNRGKKLEACPLETWLNCIV